MSTQSTNNNESLIKRLFAAGAHFGFSKSRRHPSVAKYIFTQKEGTDIFDLEKTSVLLQEAADKLTEAGKNGKTVLFVGTKDEASAYVKETAETLSLPYVTNRWIGGMLTNFGEIKKRIQRMKVLLEERESGELERKYTKKERVMIGREIDKLSFNFGGVSTLERLPAMLVVVDPKHDSIAVEEANCSNIPVVAIMSSDCDASKVDYPVLVNDAQKASLKMALNELSEAYASGKKEFTPAPVSTNRSSRRTS